MAARGLDRLRAWSSPSWVEQLIADPQHAEFFPNRTSRPVKSGHYVPVRPTPLPKPTLVAVSRSFLKEIELTEEECRSDDRFVRLFSGDVDDFSDSLTQVTWATPYALSIFGQDMTDNCPFKTGEGYGDGRAISIAELVVPSTAQRWEFQLKGAGKTPFCRGGDGRAVLRSSVREFLASEAMHHLGVSTTRAISLVVSEEERIRRPWYSNTPRDVNLPSLDSLPPPWRMMMMMRMQSMRDPDVMVTEKAAISCRVAPSFIRVGHLQLFQRRVNRSQADGNADKIKQSEKELRMMVEFALFREYPMIQGDTLQDKILSFLEEVSRRLATLAADWIRVGYCQGNFNSDNCLIAGRTMDYGPFGFIERFRRYWNMWVGGGEHFSFMNQPLAAMKNFESLIDAMEPLLDGKGCGAAQQIGKEFKIRVQETMSEMWRRKLGLQGWGDVHEQLIENILDLMEEYEADYTIFWRQLACYPELYLTSPGTFVGFPEDSEELLRPLIPAFYDKLSKPSAIASWVRRWLSLVQIEQANTGIQGSEISQSMRRSSPKYVPREWMLVRAYSEAEKGNYNVIEQLQRLFEQPYDEQKEYENEYYRRAPDAVYVGLGQGGVAYMS